MFKQLGLKNIILLITTLSLITLVLFRMGTSFFASDVTSLNPDDQQISTFSQTNDLNVADTSQTSVSVSQRNGGVVRVPNFLNISNTGFEQLADDFYRVFETRSGGLPIASLYYYATDGSFILSLEERPIGLARREAELDLKDALQLSESELCTIQIVVNTTRYVDIDYAGRDLGLSFCEGSVPLE